MGAGARRRALRRAAEDAAAAQDAAEFWYDMAAEWAGPQRGRTVERGSDAAWALEVARAAQRGADILGEGPASLRDLGRLVRARALADDAIARAVGRLRVLGATWEQIAGELGVTAEGARKRYRGAGPGPP